MRPSTLDIILVHFTIICFFFIFNEISAFESHLTIVVEENILNSSERVQAKSATFRGQGKDRLIVDNRAVGARDAVCSYVLAGSEYIVIGFIGCIDEALVDAAALILYVARLVGLDDELPMAIVFPVTFHVDFPVVLVVVLVANGIVYGRGVY